MRVDAFSAPEWRGDRVGQESSPELPLSCTRSSLLDHLDGSHWCCSGYAGAVCAQSDALVRKWIPTIAHRAFSINAAAGFGSALNKKAEIN